MSLFLSERDIVALTILKEGESKSQESFDAIAWLIYNRCKHNSEFGKTPKEVCLKIGQFETWSPFWGANDVPIEDMPIGHKELMSNKDFDYCLSLAHNILEDKPPTDDDLTNGALHSTCMSLDPISRHPYGLEISGHWFYK